MNLIQGDCLEELKKLDDKSVDFVYLDLPYGQTSCHWDEKLDLKALWIELKRVAKNDRTPFFFSCTTKFGFELFNNAPKGWFRWDLVWKKNRAAGFLNAYKLPMRKHEMIYCFAKKCPEYDVSSHNEIEIKPHNRTKPNAEIYGDCNRVKTDKIHKEPLPTSDITPPAEENVIVDRPTASPYGAGIKDVYINGKKGGRTNHKEPLPTSDITQEDAPSSWCDVDLDSKVGHRTAKPVKLMEFLLKYWTKEGDIVLDPTAGSGSMGVACKNMGRQFIGIEKDDDIFKLMSERLDK